MGIAYIVGLNFGQSHPIRQEAALKAEGLTPASIAAPRAEIKCGKQDIREYLHACSTQRRMETVK